VYAERGRREDSVLTWRMVLDLLPDDPEASEELEAAGGARPAPAVAPPPAGVQAPRPGPPPGAAVPSPPPPGGAAPIGRLLTEADVYLKYGLHQKALDHVQKIFAEDAENPDALERIRDIRDAMGDRQGAVEAAERVVQSLLARGGEGRVEHAIERLRQLAPDRAEVAVEDVEVLPQEAGESELEPAEELVPRDDQGPAPVDDDEPPALELQAEAAPQVEEIRAADVEEIGAADVEEILPEPPPAPSPPSSGPPPLPEAVHPPLEAELEEVDFYERQGLLEEALLAVRELAAAHPGHPDVERVKARIEGLAGPEAVPQQSLEPEAIPPASDSYGSTGTTGIFDLGPELSAELGPDLTPTPTGEFQYSVADVFEQFKRGLEKTVRPEDSATKYDLGIAFQEMGMLDEALEQFQSALAGGDRRRDVEILNMIGVCQAMKGEQREAVETYRRALRSEFITSDGAKAIQFELGAAHEALGEPETALWHYQKIAHDEPGYRGVGERVARLGGGPGTPPDAEAGEPRPGPNRKKARSR